MPTPKKIRLKRGILEYRPSDNDTYNWYYNNKVMTPYVMSHYKYYDPALGGFRSIDEYGDTPVYTPIMNNLYKQMENERNRRYEMVGDQYIKKVKDDKDVTLRTKGNMNLATIPYSVLDAIALRSGRTNTDMKTNLGLIGKESTFGGYSKYLNADSYEGYMGMDPYELVNNHAYFNVPGYDYITAVSRKYDFKNDKDLLKAEADLKYAQEHGMFEPTTKHYSDDVLEDAFLRYADNPNLYNPGQKNYIPMVTNIGNEVWGDAGFQEYWNSRGKQLYEQGLSERPKQKCGGLIRRRLSNGGYLSE